MWYYVLPIQNLTKTRQETHSGQIIKDLLNGHNTAVQPKHNVGINEKGICTFAKGYIFKKENKQEN